MKLKRVIRLDSMPITRASFTPEGFLMDTPILTCTGIFEYSNPDGSVRKELRLPEEVFSKESLASYEGSPIIISHDAGLITKDNVAENEIGTILSKGFKDGENVRAKIVIHDTDEMKASGLKELSLGYNLDLDETPGVWNGEKYDAIQRNIRINHLALVREARAGEQARLNIDGKGAEKKGVSVMGYRKTTKTRTKGRVRRVRRADGILSPDELKEAIKEYRARHPEAGQGGNTDEDEELKDLNLPPVTEDEDDVTPEEEMTEEIREKMQAKADAEEDDLAQANETIQHQDEDIQTLLDIIDTLLAERDFKGAKTDEGEELPPEEENQDDEDADIPFTNEQENQDEDEEIDPTLAEDEDEEEDPALVEDEDEELDPYAEDEDEELDPYAEDEDEEVDPELAEDDADEDIPVTTEAEAKVMNADSIDKIVRTRVKLGIVAEKLHLDGLENMPLRAAKKAVIRMVRPNIRLDGKGDTYINAMFDLACDDVKARTRKDTRFQKKQMFNRDSRRAVSRRRGNSAEDARQRMIARRQKKRSK